MAWRDTLVVAWKQLAEEMGAKQIEVQGQANNGWRCIAGIERLKQGYDEVAKRNGFTYDKISENWTLDLVQPKEVK